VRQDEYETMYAHELRHWWFRGRRRVLVDLLRQYAAGGNGQLRILDYGCGTGGNSPSYAPFGPVCGIEPDPRAVHLAGRRGGAALCRASGTELPFRPDSFDVVIASDVLEHIDDDVRAVQEIVRVLRPGGAFIFSVPAHPWLFGPHDAALFHRRRYVERGLRSLVEESGLRIRRLSYWNSTLLPLYCAHRLVGRFRGSQSAHSDVHALPRFANELLAGLLAVEAALLRRFRLPWGLSLIGIAVRA
jgi:SAM-dependent methyltransferase